MIKAIIFDFDGVIVESVQVKTDAFAEIYNPFGKEIVQKVVKHHKANGGISRFEKFELYHKEFLGIGLTVQEINQMSKIFSSIVLENVISAPYVKGAYEFISKHNRDYDYFISSATPEDEILEIVKAREILKFFNGVYGSPEQKDQHIKKIIKENKYNNSEIVFIGDAVSDRNAAKNNNIRFIARIISYESCLLNEKHTMLDLYNLKNIINEL